MSSKCYDYLAHIGEILEKVKTTQWDSIEKSAKKMAETIAAGHSEDDNQARLYCIHLQM